MIEFLRSCIEGEVSSRRRWISTSATSFPIVETTASSRAAQMHGLRRPPACARQARRGRCRRVSGRTPFNWRYRPLRRGCAYFRCALRCCRPGAPARHGASWGAQRGHPCRSLIIIGTVIEHPIPSGRNPARCRTSRAGYPRSIHHEICSADPPPVSDFCWVHELESPALGWKPSDPLVDARAANELYLLWSGPPPALDSRLYRCCLR